MCKLIDEKIFHCHLCNNINSYSNILRLLVPAGISLCSCLMSPSEVVLSAMMFTVHVASKHLKKGRFNKAKNMILVVMLWLEIDRNRISPSDSSRDFIRDHPRSLKWPLKCQPIGGQSSFPDISLLDIF